MGSGFCEGSWDSGIISSVSFTSIDNNNNNNNNNKYSSLPPDYIFQPVAIETFGPLNASAVNFLSEVGRRLTSLSGDSRETSFLFQRLSMLIQRFNSTLIIDSFCFSDEDLDL